MTTLEFLELKQLLLNITEGLHYVVFLLSIVASLQLGSILYFVFGTNRSK